MEKLLEEKLNLSSEDIGWLSTKISDHFESGDLNKTESESINFELLSEKIKSRNITDEEIGLLAYDVSINLQDMSTASCSLNNPHCACAIHKP